MGSLAKKGGRFWVEATFIIVMVLVYLPSVVFVYAVMADAEELFFKAPGFIGHEAGHLARIGRPVSALFVNIPLYFLNHLEDFRYARAFSLLTIIVVGLMMIRILASKLWVHPAVALTIATGTMCLPGFIFSVMNPTAWPLHLLSLVFAVAAYACLAPSHRASLFFAEQLRRFEVRAVWRAYFGSDRLGSVIMAILLLELSLFTYPPNALIVLVFSVAVLLFSPLPAPVRGSLVLRDLGLLAGGIAIFVLVSKLVYFPLGEFMGLLRPLPAVGPSSEYRFAFEFRPADILERLGESFRVAKDLWFLPNHEMFVLAAYGVIAVLLLASHVRGLKLQPGEVGKLGRSLAAIAFCYVVSVAPVIFSVGGLISYRTVVPATAIVMVVVLFAAAKAFEGLASTFALLRPWARLGWAHVVPVLVLIFWTTSYAICSVIQITQNELAYIASAIKEAVEQGADGVMLLDGRPNIGPDQLPVAQDVRGHALLAYESGCFSTYCIGAPGIYAVTKEQLGLPKSAIDAAVFRGAALKGVTCEKLRADPSQFASMVGWHSNFEADIKLQQYLEQRRNVACRSYDTGWMDLQRHADSQMLRNSARIDRSVWRVFLP